MSREVKRVPLDFDAPIGETWAPLLMPERLRSAPCKRCDGSGYSPYARLQQDRWYGNVPFDPAETGSTPYTADTAQIRARAEWNVSRAPEYYGTGERAIVREAERLAQLFNGYWSHHLAQEDVDALIAGDRLWDLTRTWSKDGGWQPIDPPPVVTAEQVNLWSIAGGLGHDAINCWKVVDAKCERDGRSKTCWFCDGQGSHERYPGQRAEAEAWKPAEIPAGDGWQLWQTVSEGGPVSPVFATGDELAEWMVANPKALGPFNQGLTIEGAKRWVHGPGWAPSGLSVGGEFVSPMAWAAGGEAK